MGLVGRLNAKDPFFNLASLDMREPNEIRVSGRMKEMRRTLAIATPESRNDRHLAHLTQHLSPMMLKTLCVVAIPCANGSDMLPHVINMPMFRLLTPAVSQHPRFYPTRPKSTPDIEIISCHKSEHSPPTDLSLGIRPTSKNQRVSSRFRFHKEKRGHLSLIPTNKKTILPILIDCNAALQDHNPLSFIFYCCVWQHAAFQPFKRRLITTEGRVSIAASPTMRPDIMAFDPRFFNPPSDVIRTAPKKSILMPAPHSRPTMNQTNQDFPKGAMNSDSFKTSSIATSPPLELWRFARC